MYGTSIDPLNVSFTLDEISVPELDLYSDSDINAVNTVDARQSAYNAGTDTSYTQNTLSCTGSSSCHQLVGAKGDDTQEF